jgi:hypothetical protein
MGFDLSVKLFVWGRQIRRRRKGCFIGSVMSTIFEKLRKPFSALSFGRKGVTQAVECIQKDLPGLLTLLQVKTGTSPYTRVYERGNWRNYLF